MIRYLVAALLFALASPAQAQEGPSAAEALAQVTGDAGCQRHDYPDLETTIYVCDRGLTYWYFTIPSETVPPGYIRRAAVRRDGAIYMETRGHYDGTYAQQAQFDAWTQRLVASLPN
jgi:hypothetical protein